MCCLAVCHRQWGRAQGAAQPGAPRGACRCRLSPCVNPAPCLPACASRPPQAEVSPWDGKAHEVLEVSTELHTGLRAAVKRFLADDDD